MPNQDGADAHRELRFSRDEMTSQSCLKRLSTTRNRGREGVDDPLTLTGASRAAQLDLPNPAQRATVTSEMAPAPASGEPRECEGPFGRDDGEYHRMWHQDSADGNGGKIATWSSSSVYVDDREQAEQRLREQEWKLRRSEAYLAESQKLSLTGSFGWKPSTGEIVWSDETYRILQ
jgi:hypothetical protein